MLFTEPVFFVFFLAVFAVAWLDRSARRRKLFLLAASYLFYAAWDWRFLSLIAFSTLVDFGVGLALARATGPPARRALLVASLGVNLGLLGGLQVLGFFVESAAGLLLGARHGDRGAGAEIVLPVGISFYTFQTLSYTDRRLPAASCEPEREPRWTSPSSSRSSPSSSPGRSCARPTSCRSSTERLRWRDVRVAPAPDPIPGRLLQEGRASPTTSRPSSTASSPTPAPFTAACDALDRRTRSTPSRSTATSPATPTWPSRCAGAPRVRLDRNFDLPLPRRERQPTSGAAGTSRSPPGCATTSTSRWAATAGPRLAPTATCC